MKMLTEEQYANAVPRMLLSGHVGALGCNRLVSPQPTELNHCFSRIYQHA